MNLAEIRAELDGIVRDMLELRIERPDSAHDVAEAADKISATVSRLAQLLLLAIGELGGRSG